MNIMNIMNKDNLYLDRLTELATEISKQRGWKQTRITSLGLNYNNNVLGMNVDNGTQIKIRLKDSNHEYLPWYQLVGTLCHELAHNEIAEHSPEFYKLMDNIHDDIEKLSRYDEIFSEMNGETYSKGYTAIKPKNENNRNKSKNATAFKNTNGTILQKNITFVKPRTKEGKRKLILESLKGRGL